nr:putative 1,11 carbon cyclization sesquiterpene synthase 255 [Hypholoma fasciculare]
MALSQGNSTITTVTLPDTLRFWPWQRHINPHYSSCKKASSEWVGCDLMNLFFIIDEHTDIASSETARTQADIVMDAIRNPEMPRPENEWVGGKAAQQFWHNATKSATPSAHRRFVDTFQMYMDAVVQEAIDRNENYVRDIDSYFVVRRDTIGAKPSFAICELYLNLPDSVMAHPVIEKLTELCIDLIIIGNDLCSYKVEHEHGDDGHNLITVVMNQFKITPQAAINYISGLHDKLAIQFLDEWKNIPTLGGPLDLESERYFGKRGIEIQTTRQIELNIQSHL